MKFEKWQALGNDYLIVERDRLGFELTPARVRKLCEPHFGVFADGVLELSRPQDERFVARLRIFNPDGSEAELSGNGAREAIRDIAKKERPHLGADQANGAARYGNRIAARGESLPRTGRRLARNDPQPGRGDIQLFSGDLRQRGEDALADLDLAGRKPHAARFLEADPGAEQRIVQQALRQILGRRGHGSAPIEAPARATARMIRLCTPQRQRWRSSAAAISLRLGRGLRASNAAAEIRMPERQ